MYPLGSEVEEGPLEVPANARFRVIEYAPGAADEWGVYDEDLNVVPTRREEYPELFDVTWVEFIPAEPLTEGESYALLPVSLSGGRQFVVTSGIDQAAPLLHDVRFDGTTRMRDTSCGDVDVLHLAWEFPNDEGPLFTRMYDATRGVYWHSPALVWSDLCGGFPPFAWDGPKDFTLVDAAGNSSDAVTLRRCGGCDTRPRRSALFGAHWAFMLWVAAAYGRGRPVSVVPRCKGR